MTWARKKQTENRVSRTNHGFTIVELLIVIVIIAILAAVTIVAYNGVQARASFSRAQSDLKTIVKALELYKVDNGTYPPSDDRDGCTYDWCGWDQATGDAFIVGLSPKYISVIPQMPSEQARGDTYLYQGRGNDYQLIRYKNNPSLHTTETQDNPLLALTNGYYEEDPPKHYAWGYRTNTNEWW